jgi:hypothetical protein
MQLVLSNAQGELSALERGMHALVAVEKAGITLKRYASLSKRAEATVYKEANAADVAKTAQELDERLDVINSLTYHHLRVIHNVPKHCWLALVRRAIGGKLNEEQLVAAVKAVNAVKPPRGYEALFQLERLQVLAAEGRDCAEARKASGKAQKKRISLLPSASSNQRRNAK